jgi:PadR family transcriptional regulator PadR
MPVRLASLWGMTREPSKLASHGGNPILPCQCRHSISIIDIMAQDVLRHLFTGFVRLHILYHAAKQSVCGVEMMDELRHHGYKIGPGTMYPILHDLEQAGHLSSEEEIVQGKRRKNFRITPRGKKLLVEAREKLRELAGEILEDHDDGPLAAGN